MPSPTWNVLADNGVEAFARSAELHADDVDAPSLTAKFDVAPEVWATRANRDPVASVTTLALTPMEAELMAVAREDKEVIPFVPREKVAAVPLLGVMVRVDDPRAELSEATGLEYQEAAVAKLLTTMVWVPAEEPDADVPVTAEELLEATVVALKAPPGSFKELRSFETLARAV